VGLRFQTGRSFYVRLKLRDGERLGGFFEDESFASAYPEEQDLFLQEAWRLAEDGSFVERMRGSQGVLVRQDTIDFVELLTPEEVRDGQEA
jgi:Family of unknown function (DUF6338)